MSKPKPDDWDETLPQKSRPGLTVLQRIMHGIFGIGFIVYGVRVIVDQGYWGRRGFIRYNPEIAWIMGLMGIVAGVVTIAVGVVRNPYEGR